MNEDILDILCDENNTDPITLYNERGEALAFEQIALIPLDGGEYVILKPVEQLAGMGADEALVFAIIRSQQGTSLEIVVEDAIIDAVFDVYDRLLEESGVQ